jgi:hypothetical protein
VCGGGPDAQIRRSISPGLKAQKTKLYKAEPTARLNQNSINLMTTQ